MIQYKFLSGPWFKVFIRQTAIYVLFLGMAALSLSSSFAYLDLLSDMRVSQARMEGERQSLQGEKDRAKAEQARLQLLQDELREKPQSLR